MIDNWQNIAATIILKAGAGVIIFFFAEQSGQFAGIDVIIIIGHHIINRVFAVVFKIVHKIYFTSDIRCCIAYHG